MILALGASRKMLESLPVFPEDDSKVADTRNSKIQAPESHDTAVIGSDEHQSVDDDRGFGPTGGFN